MPSPLPDAVVSRARSMVSAIGLSEDEAAEFLRRIISAALDLDGTHTGVPAVERVAAGIEKLRGWPHGTAHADAQAALSALLSGEPDA